MAAVSKQLFVKVANQFAVEWSVACAEPNPASREARKGTLRVMAYRLADVFAAENPNFDRDRFLAACRVEN